MKSDMFGISRYSKMNLTGSDSNLAGESIAFKIGGGVDSPDASIHRTGESRRER